MAHAKKPDARSPYQKYGKSPYRYSPLYQSWRAAVTTPGREKEARRLSDEHTQAMHREKPLLDPPWERRKRAFFEAAAHSDIAA